MDDMLGSSEVYRSPTKREKIRRVVQEDLLSRLMDGGAALQMETRRGIHDTTAWLLGEFPDVWEDHTWRCYDAERGGYLWPSQYGEKWRATMPHLTNSAPVWRSLYQQEPIAEGGTIIDPSWLEATYSEPPDVAASLADLRVFGVDLASTGKQTSDPCAFVVVAVRGAFVDVVFAYQNQMDYPRARQYLTELGIEWDTNGGVVELAANGDALVADLAAVVPGIRGERATRDKVARLTPWLPMMAARQLRLPAKGAPWVRSFREAVLAFSGTDGDDDHFIDALVWALVAADTGTGQMTVDDWDDAF
jgi:phage terminase large subunit-like protein